MANPQVSRRVARALYATPNALSPELLKLVTESTDTVDSFEELPEKVRAIVRWVEQYIGEPPAAGSSSSEEMEEAEDGAAGA